jgi:hypothetical protein
MNQVIFLTNTKLEDQSIWPQEVKHRSVVLNIFFLLELHLTQNEQQAK